MAQPKTPIYQTQGAVYYQQAACRIFRDPHSAFRILPLWVFYIFFTLSLTFMVACTHSTTHKADPSPPMQPITGEAEIQQSWQGDYPVDRLTALPEKANQPGIGYIADPKTFGKVWVAFNPKESEPHIDFKENLVIFVRNIHYYNRIQIGKIKLEKGVAEVLAMETLSARQIEDVVAISMAMVSRKGITGIQAREGVIQVAK